MSSAPQFKILPLSIPIDIPSILRINYHVTVQNPLHQAKTSLISESEYISSGIPGAEKQFSGKNASRNRMAKMVLDDPNKSDADKMVVAYVVFKTPVPPHSAKSSTESAAAFAQEMAELQVPNGVDRDIVVGLMTEARLLNKKYLGQDYESRYWELDALATLPEYQRMGLGSRLVKWGIDMVEADMKLKPGEVDGIYLVASPAGSSTYRQARFVEVGERFLEMNGQESYRHCWFVKRFENNQQHSGADI
jgi:GNAT superfamily N-acetyltransferase